MVVKFEELSAREQHVIDVCCDRFEHEKRSGTHPSLERYLDSASSEEARSVLLVELLMIELEYHRPGEESCELETLLDRLPDYRPLIEKTVWNWRRCRQGDPDAQIHDAATKPADASNSAGRESDVVAAARQGLNPAVLQIGHYRLEEEIGGGAFGRVWKAHDLRLKRSVAIKMPRSERSSEIDRQRFLQEAQLTAQLVHPNVVTIHEVGWHDGQAYIVSDFVTGGSLQDWRRQPKRSAAEVASQCIQIAEGLQRAHELGIVHRDLKPSNILIDDEGRPRITDFGLAKCLDTETLTLAGSLLGTPAYMSPEQARGDAARADHRADIYAMGVILFELLSGERPFQGSPEMIVHQVIYRDPPLLRLFDASMPRDLETICQKCLAKDPAKRYATAKDLADDLRRFQRGEPIRARRVSWPEKVWSASKRNPALAAATAACLLLLICFAIGGLVVAGRLSKEIREVQRYKYFSDIAAARQALGDNNPRLARERLRLYRDELDVRPLRGIEWFMLWHQADHFGEAVLLHQQKAHWLDVSPNGRFVASVGSGKVRIWNVSTRQLVREFDGWQAAWAPQTQQVTIVDEAGIHVRNVESGSRISSVAWRPPDTGRADDSENQVRVWTMAISADTTRLATADYDDDRVTVWDLRSGEGARLSGGPVAHEDGAPSARVYQLAASPVDNRIAAACLDGNVRVWDLDTRGDPLVIPHPERWARQVTFSPDGRMLASTNSKAVLLWDAKTGELLNKLPFYSAESVAFSPDGRMLAAGEWGRTVKIWDLTSRQLVVTLLGHSSFVHAVKFLPNGQLASLGALEGEIIIRDVPRGDPNVLARYDHPVRSVAVSRDGRYVAAVSEGGVLKVFDAMERRVIDKANVSPSDHARLALSPDDKRLALTDQSVIQLFDFPSLQRQRTLSAGEAKLTSVAFSIEKSLLAGDQNGTLWVWAAPLRDPVQQHRVCTAPLENIALSLDGRLAVASDRDVICFDLQTMTEQHRCRGHSDRVYDVAFSPCDPILATASRDGTVRLWNADNAHQLRKLTGHGNYVASLVFAPDGRTLVTGSMELKLWSVAAYEELITLPGETSFWYDLECSADGQTLVGGNDDYSVWIWRAPHTVD